MGQLELSSHSFALRSGVREEGDRYATCLQPDDANLKRKGALALMVEPAGDHPSLADEACRLAEAVINRQFFSDTSLSLTTSLLSALDSANRAVLEHDYGQNGQDVQPGSDSSVAVQGGGVRAKGAKVGVTTALFRPDGGGVYLAQLAPTQAYVVHNNLVQALPEPPGWSEVPEPEVENELWADEDATASAAPIPFPSAHLPAQSLGSKPGIIVDLIYRRVEKGDLLVIVSPALARYIDRATAESIFLGRDAGTTLESLYEIAERNGLARANATVIGIGGSEATREASHSDERAPYISETRSASSNDQSGGTLAALRARLPFSNVTSNRFKELAARGRQGNPPAVSDNFSEATGGSEANEINDEPSRDSSIDDSVSTPEADVMASQAEELQYPTATLLQSTLDVPPYKQPTLLFAEGEGNSEAEEETQYDGWEDLPPTLISSKYPVLQRVPTGTEGAPASVQAHPYLRETHMEAPGFTPTRIYNIQRPPPPPFPHIEFGEDLLDDKPVAYAQEAPVEIGRVRSLRPKLALPQINRPQISRPQISRPRVRISPEQIQRGKSALLTGAKVGANALKSLMPERVETPSAGDKYGTKKMVVPRRTIIAGAMVLLAAILVFSLFASAGNKSQKAVVNYLQDAKQEDLLANQPGITDVERQTHLSNALDKAQKALLADPQSAEAKRLVTKEQSVLDKVQGVTRTKEPKLLFDLGKIGANGDVTATAGVTTTFMLSDMVVQSDDAYLFDKAGGRIYRCKIAAQTCASVLASGDSAGGGKAGTLIAMTMRVGSLVALDDKLVAYIYNADKSSWQAQPLGNSAGLQKPKDIATYDGNLYLLDAKPGQISKYAANAYGSAPTDWLQDSASLDQVKNPAAIAIDGIIYVLLGDGKVLAMQGGKVIKTIAPTGTNTSPAIDLFTSTDTSDLYLLRADGTITRVSKEGQTVATLKPGATQDSDASLSGIAVDEGRGKLYLLKGEYVYEAVLPARAGQIPTDGAANQPTPRPTVEP